MRSDEQPRRTSASAIAAASAVVGLLFGCASQTPPSVDSNGSSSGSSSGGNASSSGGGTLLGDATPLSGDASPGCGLTCFIDATVPVMDAGSDVAVTQPPPGGVVSVSGGSTAGDCPGCMFPPASAPPCSASAPPIKLVYPPDTVLLPPNLNVVSVQWTPFGPPYTRYEVDFSQTLGPATTDWRIVTACKTQTTNMQAGGAPSGGCEITVDPVSWSNLVLANRGGTNPISVTVRGTTDGTCATTSTNVVHLSIAEEDLLGTYYYWKSTVSTNGTGGQIWAKVFGDLNNKEVDVTSAAIPDATCNGCHSLSRDGSRMVVYSDDDDSDDEYSDIGGSYLDMTPLFAKPATVFPGGVIGSFLGGGQPPGFSTINPVASYYVSSNGYPCTAAASAADNGCDMGSSTSNGYATAVPTNGWSVWNGTNGAFVGGVTVGPTGKRPTMPDWSIDGTQVVYVQPGGVIQYDVGSIFGTRNDDMHIYGGSLYTVPYTGKGAFGTPTPLLQSAGENNYYPSYSPDNPMSFIIFNRVDDMKAGSKCTGSDTTAGFCLDDSYSNPAARLMLLSATAAGAAPVDLEKANGSPASAKVPLSNSYPRWAPFVQSYHSNKILWFTFSSTRDYGVRILNNKTGLVQCYPPDAAEWPGGSHGGSFSTNCKEPQLWMAPLTFTEAQSPTADPSGVAFWIPYQDMTTHNHTAQWTWKPNPPPPPVDAGQPPPCTCSMVYGPCGASNGGCGCCDGHNLVCTGSGQCIQPPM